MKTLRFLTCIVLLAPLISCLFQRNIRVISVNPDENLLSDGNFLNSATLKLHIDERSSSLEIIGVHYGYIGNDTCALRGRSYHYSKERGLYIPGSKVEIQPVNGLYTIPLDVSGMKIMKLNHVYVTSSDNKGEYGRDIYSKGSRRLNRIDCNDANRRH